MFRYNFKIALRQIQKQKMYAVIKVGGFALSISACILIALFIKDELSYDKSYPDANRIYRVVGSAIEGGTANKWVSFPAPMSGVIKKDFPQVEMSARLMPNTLFPGAGSNEVRTADQKENTHEDGFSYADQGLIDLLKIQMIYGSRTNALADPNTIIISKSRADKYFPDQNPVGKTLILNNETDRPFRIGGVMQDFPANSHFKYNFLLTLAGREWGQGEQTSWDNNNYIIYTLVHTGTDIPSLEKKLTTDIKQNYYLPTMLKEGDKNAEQELSTFALHLQPVSDIHLRSFDIEDNLTHGDIRFVWLFGIIACFILSIACINFINLSTAKSANRAKEVGLRKVIGSYRSGLINQFLTESMLFSLLSFVIGLAIAWSLLPLFNRLSEKSLTIPFAAWWMTPLLLLSAIFTGFLAGLYPAFYLSSFKPIQVLKGQLSSGSRNAVLRNGLVVFQFTISIILIISTIIIYNQTRYMLNRELGYDKEQVVLLHGANTMGDEVKVFRNELQKLPQVKNVSIGDYLPVANTKRNGNTFWNEGKAKIETGVDVQFWLVDHDYIKTLGMKIMEGRDFSPNMKSDSGGVIINQTMASKLNLKNPIGKTVTNGYGIFKVIGVVKDFNFESMQQNIGALCMFLGNSPSIVTVKVSTADIKGTIASISGLWKKFSPSQSIRYSFLDENFASMYADVQRMTAIFTSFAILAIIIACLGLFALSAFMAEQRSKEIGVRKVLGASITGITALMSKDFVKLVVVAIVIASPIAWWAMTKWLQDFAYRAPITWVVFVLSAIIAIGIALFTVSFQSIKVARANPVTSLRSE